MSKDLGSPVIAAGQPEAMASETIQNLRARLAELASDLRAAMAHHREGRLDEAEALYRKLLDAAPNHPQALRFSLASSKLSAGDPSAAWS